MNNGSAGKPAKFLGSRFFIPDYFTLLFALAQGSNVTQEEKTV